LKKLNWDSMFCNVTFSTPRGIEVLKRFVRGVAQQDSRPDRPLRLGKTTRVQLTERFYETMDGAPRSMTSMSTSAISVGTGCTQGIVLDSQEI
jgi:hypothetical protein